MSSLSPVTPRFAFYADDFTGATDALEQLARAGQRARLFLSPPTATQLAGYPGVDAIGVAGLARSLSPKAMADELRPAFRQLRELGIAHVHYKVCSTFDSSPEVGSIGCAIEVGQDVFHSPFVPVLVGSPRLGRFCIFGNLFARYGIGSAGAIHRLDRHPSVSRHPVTPMKEADLRLHLSKQTSRPIELIDVLCLDAGEQALRSALRDSVDRRREILLFDTLTVAHLESIGRLLVEFESPRQPLFSVGSSAVETALFANRTGETASFSFHERTSATTLVISGSCSPVTSAQISHSRAHGFEAWSFGDVSSRGDLVVESLNAGRSGIIYTCLGEANGALAPADVLGTALGRFARDILPKTKASRLVIAGGDTSSYAARALGVEGLEIKSFLVPGAPICRATIPDSELDGLELICKGGQVGAPDFFNIAASGTSS